MSELSKLYACLRIAQEDDSDEEVEFWLKEIEKEKKERLLTLLSHWANECERNEFWNKEDEQAYRQIVALIKKPEVTVEWIEKKVEEKKGEGK